MASIISRTTGTETEQRIALLNEEMGRTISIGSNWSELRIGVRVSCSRTTAFGSTLPFFFGLSSGTTDMYTSLNTTNFAGVRSAPTAPWGFTSPAHKVGSLGNNGVQKIVKVGSTETAELINVGFAPNIGVAGLSVSQIFLLFKKGASETPTSWRMHCDFSSNATHVTHEQFLDNMQKSTDAALSGTSRIANAPITVDEITNGILDTVCFGWQGGSDTFEISDIAYSRLS